MSLTVFSQKDTVPTKSFPIPIVKEIVKDLLSGDQAKEELKLTNVQLAETEKKVLYKDSIINVMKKIDLGKDTIIISQNKKFEILKEQTQRLEKALNTKKRKTLFTNIGSGLIIGTLTILLLIK
jgi:hypothetical protein